MSVDRQKQVARSITALDDQASIESRPLEDINADLKALGIDPKASIMAARKRSLERSSPAGRLLARLDEGDAIASEIETLASADIANVRAAISAGTVAAIAATAKGQSGRQEKVVALKRPGRRFWGSLIGIAACLLLFIAIRPDLLDRTERAAIERRGETDALSDRLAARDAAEDDAHDREIDRSPAAPAAQRAAPKVETADRSARPEAPSPRVVAPGIPAPKARAASENFVAEVEKNADAPAKPEARPAAKAAQGTREPLPVNDQPAADPPDDDQIVVNPASAPVPAPARRPAQTADLDAESPLQAVKNLGAIQKALTEADPNGTLGVTDRDRHQAILIVDPDLAPRELKEKARTLPEGDLIERLDEARILLSPRPVLALVTLLRAGEPIDGAVTVRRPVGDVATTTADGALSRAAGGGFELIELPRKP